MLQFFTKKRGEKGFTLIELLVVIAVIGMLASIVLVSLGPVRKKGRDARRMSDIRQIGTAMEMCYDDADCSGSEKYPDTAAQEIGPDSTNWKTIDTDGTPLYLTIPKDPLNSGDQQYKSKDGTDQWYCIYVKLEAPTAATWFCASNRGVAQKEYTGPPTKDDCCGFDVD